MSLYNFCADIFTNNN